MYVEYVGVAPWNIATPAHPVRRFKGLGTLLLETAAGLAREVVGQPRVGLHSKETALEFYRRTRWLNELGPDVTDDGVWVYFEGSWKEDQP